MNNIDTVVWFLAVCSVESWDLSVLDDVTLVHRLISSSTVKA